MTKEKNHPQEEEILKKNRDEQKQTYSHMAMCISDINL